MRPGWTVTPSFKLPEGFELYEDEHFLYLYHTGNRLAVFSSTRTTPGHILYTCEEFLACGKLE